MNLNPVQVSCNDILPEHVVVVNEKFTSRHNRVKVHERDSSNGYVDRILWSGRVKGGC